MFTLYLSSSISLFTGVVLKTDLRTYPNDLIRVMPAKANHRREILSASRFRSGGFFKKNYCIGVAYFFNWPPI